MKRAFISMYDCYWYIEQLWICISWFCILSPCCIFFIIFIIFPVELWGSLVYSMSSARRNSSNFFFSYLYHFTSLLLPHCSSQCLEHNNEKEWGQLCFLPDFNEIASLSLEITLRANQNNSEISCYPSHNGRDSKCWRGNGERAALIHCWWDCRLLQSQWKSQ